MGDSPGRPPALQGPSKGSRWTWQASAASSLTGFPPNGVPPLTGFPPPNGEEQKNGYPFTTFSDFSCFFRLSWEVPCCSQLLSLVLTLLLLIFMSSTGLDVALEFRSKTIENQLRTGGSYFIFDGFQWFSDEIQVQH